MLQMNTIRAFATGWWPSTPQGRGGRAPIRELPLSGANKIPALTGTLSSLLVPTFKCPMTHASSDDGHELSEEWANAGVPLPVTQPTEEEDIPLLESLGAESESGSDSSESEPGEEEADNASMNADPPDDTQGMLFLVNLRSGCFHALITCESTDKGAIAVSISGVEQHFCTACGKQPTIQEVSFKRPQYLEACRMKCCQAILN